MSLVPEDLIETAREMHSPIATVCLFSGGNDSAVLAHRCKRYYDKLVFIDTGTAVPGVIEFVEEYAGWLGKPLSIYSAGDEYRKMVLGTEERPALGFPGPGQHHRCYQRLKERALRAMLKKEKVGHPRSARVLALTGVRRDESKRRANREPLTREGSLAFCNPLIDWTNEDMRLYRETHKLAQSDVAALIHRSGECNCGSFAAPGERDMMESLWPEWFDTTIGSLEREAEAKGIRACKWGERPPGGRSRPAGSLCTDCEGR